MKVTPNFMKTLSINKSATIQKGIDEGFMNLYLAMWKQAVLDEHKKATWKLGLHVYGISKELSLKIKQILYEDTFYFPDYDIYDEGKIWKFHVRPRNNDYLKINNELERRKDETNKDKL